MPSDWKLNGEGLAAFVERLEGVLLKMLGASSRLPRTVFTDRGTGMHIPSGRVVKKYETAIDAAGFKLYWGGDAQRQSPDMGDVLLHETAVAWFRKKMRQYKPEVLPWMETVEMWTLRARRAVASINKEYDGAGLCREFPSRLQCVAEGLGERLRK